MIIVKLLAFGEVGLSGGQAQRLFALHPQNLSLFTTSESAVLCVAWPEHVYP